MRYAPKDAPKARERRPAVKKISTAKIKSQAAKKKVTIGMDLGDRTSRYCLLDEEGVVIGEASTPTTKAAIAKVFGAMARYRIALEAGGHSPWVSRQLQEFGHEVIVANPRNVRLIGESTRKDDRLDARTLARLARIDPMLLSPVTHRTQQHRIDARQASQGSCVQPVILARTLSDQTHVPRVGHDHFVTVRLQLPAHPRRVTTGLQR